MSDQFDQAQRVEELEREALIARSRRRVEVPPEAPAIRDCDDCGKPIPAARLNARPGATRCIGCQETFEERLR